MRDAARSPEGASKTVGTALASAGCECGNCGVAGSLLVVQLALSCTWHTVNQAGMRATPMQVTGGWGGGSRGLQMLQVWSFGIDEGIR